MHIYDSPGNHPIICDPPHLILISQICFCTACLALYLNFSTQNVLMLHPFFRANEIYENAIVRDLQLFSKENSQNCFSIISISAFFVRGNRRGGAGDAINEIQSKARHRGAETPTQGQALHAKSDGQVSSRCAATWHETSILNQAKTRDMPRAPCPGRRARRRALPGRRTSTPQDCDMPTA